MLAFWKNVTNNTKWIEKRMDVSESIVPIIVGIVQAVLIVVLIALGIYSLRNNKYGKQFEAKDIQAGESREEKFISRD
ncbi:hypothetical protein [Dehalococcoides mccartyi]|nr:hypothetical protein [Dehalococcoides mccartyi]BCT55726.1 hypothetical protein DHCNIT_0004890 [Dehalococcoides mccartyi]BEL00609.1 hypothetical protein DMOBY_04620 [Dehalococcoides mccartyi]